VDVNAERSARKLVSEAERAVIMEEQMTAASRISLVFSCGFFFLMSVWLMTHLTETNFWLVQRSVLGKRLDFCLTISLYICFFSCLFNAVQLMDDDNLLVKGIDGKEDTLNLGRPIEWMLTCPLMQLAVPVLAGEKIPDSRRATMPFTAFSVLVLGLLSTLAQTLVYKVLAYCAGIATFCGLLYLMNACIVEASSGGENLLHGSSFLRGFIVVIASTWIPFPIWHALSPEGFNVIQDKGLMKVVVSFLNVFSKGAFVLYLVRVRSEYQTRQKTLFSVGYIQKDGSPIKASFDNLNGAVYAGDLDKSVDKTTLTLIQEVLETMGRSRDLDHVVDLFESHLITSNDDILSLTKDYCVEIGLPYGLITAMKSKIRSYQVQMDDAWSVRSPKGKQDVPDISFAAPHIAKSKDKIARVHKKKNGLYTDIVESPTTTQATIDPISVEAPTINSDMLLDTRDELRAVVDMLSGLKNGNKAHIDALEKKVDSQHEDLKRQMIDGSHQLMSDLKTITQAHADALEQKVEKQSKVKDENQARIAAFEKEMSSEILSLKNELKQSFTTLFRRQTEVSSTEVDAQPEAER
jgi:bacteriorhodopsin